MKKSALTVLSAIFAMSLASCGTPAAENVQTTLAETAAEITEAETETTTAATSDTTEITTTTAAETEKVCACESDFQHACCEYMNELTVLVGGVYFGDINCDEKPEAIVGINPYGFTEVLYENEEGMQTLELETVSVWGNVRYIAATNQILFSPMFGHTWGTWGYEKYCIYDWNGSDYEITSSIFRESGYYYEDEDGEHSGYGQAYIDDKEADNDAFEVKLAEMQKLRDENDYFPIVYVYDQNLSFNPDCKSYIEENFPCFDNWDILPEE